jgi:outer membrane protein OmpA-like peptidoglycan-associated protein
MIRLYGKSLLGIMAAAVLLADAFAAPPPPSGRGRGAPAADAGAPAPATQARGGRGFSGAATRTTTEEPEVVVIEEAAPVGAEADKDFGKQMDKKLNTGAPVDTRAAAREKANERERQDIAETQFMRGIASASKSKCENELMNCVVEDCGADFQKCTGDGDGVWSARFQKCRVKTSCTGAELSVYGDIIREDIKVDSQIRLMQLIIQGNNAYSRCLQNQCATTQGTPLEGMIGFNACVTQGRINAALTACQAVYEKFRPYDSGLQARFTSMMGMLRAEKEKRIAELQKELDAMMPKMRDECKRAGAVFDDRSGECVFTAFLSVEANGRRYTPASKKIVPGSQFQCTDQWFGVDVTTYLKNAISLTVEQKTASAAFMGAGLGVGASVLTSGIADKLKDSPAGALMDKAAPAAAAIAPAATKPTEAPPPGPADKNIYKISNEKEAEVEEEAPRQVPLQLPVTFEVGKSELDSAGMTKLSGIAGQIREQIDKNRDGDWKISVAGHADITGSEKQNDMLANKRAQFIRDELKKQLGYGDLVGKSDPRFSVSGQGIKENLADKKAGENSKASEFRRADIIFTPATTPAPQPAPPSPAPGYNVAGGGDIGDQG